ncbi:MAG TPA: tetratricopeptide repeat protein [Rhodanobacteraceae bacterium]|nr:tetratricopeptide repeat protein [Rhodanobacteraceae bacterium]
MNNREPGQPTVFSELRRRNVVRATVLYGGAVWVISQGIAQLSPALGLPDWATRAFLVAAALGLPFWIAFAWIYELTPQGIRRESGVAVDQSVTRRTGRKLDFAIIAVLAVAVLLLLGNQFLWHKGVTPTTPSVSAMATASVAPVVSAVPVIPASAIPAKSVAVLPFANESGKADEQFFSDGLSEDLITALSQFAGLKVISRNSAFQFRNSKDTSAEIGKLLGVAHLLEGSVQHAQDEVRITATLVNATDGTVLWSQRYDKPYKELFALQDDITQAVADALKAKLLVASGAVVQSDRPPSGNLDAYAAYQHGIAYDVLATEASEHQAIDAFGEAIHIDPKYAAAYARLAFAWTNLAASFLNDSAKIAQAKTEAHNAADTALKLDPGSALAHLARGFVLQNADLDWTGAETEYRRALQLAPNDAGALFRLGNMLAIQGQLQTASTLTRQALAADPRHADWYKWLSAYLAALGKLDDARQAIGTAIALHPNGTFNYAHLAIIEILRGDAKGALAAALQEPAGGWRETALALAMQIGSDRSAADVALKKLIANHAGDSAYQIAEAYALRRDQAVMFHWLDRARANRDPGIGFLLFDPIILRYRDDPRFAAFCKKIGLPTATDAVAMK